jgi:uncharacterized protein YbjT (DUF2867 family)
MLRVAQFHELLDAVLHRLSKAPVAVVPTGIRLQPIAADDAARAVIESFRAGPTRTLVEVGGPEILTAEQIVRAWLRAHGRKRPVVAVSFPGPVARGFRAGRDLAPQASRPGTHFADWLQDHVVRLAPAAY